MKYVIFISEEKLYFGSTAGVVRMNNYSKSILLNNDVCVIQIPFSSNCNLNNYVSTGDRSFVFHNDVDFVRSKNFKIVNQVLLFLSRVKQFSKRINGQIVFYYYPASGSFLDIVVVFYIRYIVRKKIYIEVNEVRKFTSTPVVSLKDKLKRHISSNLLEQTFRFYNGLICISENISEFYRKKNNNRLVIPILCDFFDRIESISPLMDRVKSKDKKTVFIFAGSVAYEKENLEQLINGFALLVQEYKSLELRFYGSITKDSFAKINLLIRNLNLQDFVSYCGSYNNDEVIKILHMADALILPRANSKQNYYGFSTKLSEYSVSNVPIILTNTGVVTSFFADGFNCLMVDGYDSKAFYLKLKYFMGLDDDMKKCIANQAYKTAATFFDYKKYSDRIYDFLF